MKMWDLIIIGAGPAGSSAAHNAAEKGLQVLLIDKEEFPRDKPCGGGLSPGAYRELNEKLPGELIEKTCYGMRSIYRGKVHNIEEDTPVAFMIRRKDFDNHLLNKAISSGAAFYRRKCLKVSEFKDYVQVSTDKGEYRSRFCIGADGYFSRTAKEVRKSISDKEIRFCLVAQIPGTDHPVYSGQNCRVELDFGYIQKGYGWLFPKSDYIEAGIGGDWKNSKDLKKQFYSFLNTHNLPIPHKVTGCFIPVSNLKHKICTKRIMLTGDAAGLVDSFSGEGIKNALVSGRIAAESAVLAIERNRRLRSYKKKIYRVMASELRWSELICRMSARHEKLVYGNLLADDRIMKKYFNVLRGKKSYRSFFFDTVFTIPAIVFKKFLSHHFS